MSERIVYLYSEVMPYAISVMRAVVSGYDVIIDCIYWDNNKKTPFVPADEQGITFHKRSAFNSGTITSFIAGRNPRIIYVSGRMDQLYLNAALLFKNTCHVVTGSDNQWKGTRKQVLASMLSHIIYKKYFEYFWVPGRRQYEYARRMGYANNNIIPNLLTGDTRIFNEAYIANQEKKQKEWPHNMLYAGRFAPVKGLDILISAFTEAKNELRSDWTLTLIGAGDMPLPETPEIKVRPFMDSVALAECCKDFGAFCLPSISEPWGVVVHEFAMAGLPLICSDNVGAADDLVINNYNGLIFKSSDNNALKIAIITLMKKSDEELMLMGSRGHQLAQAQSPEIAAASLMSILN